MRSAVVLFLFCATTALAQPYLVNDIRTTGPIDGSSAPDDFVTFGSSLYFTAWGRESGGVWRLDKTASAPVQVLKGSGIVAMTPLHGELVVAGYSGIATTDGTPGSATAISPITVEHGPLLEASGRVLFVHATKELWSTDGTTSGTMKVDFHPQASPLNVALLGTFGGRAVFVSDYGVGMTDGTIGGTTTLTALVGEAGDIVISGDHFFFAGRTSADFVDLWVSDGTPGGTHAIKRLSNVAALNGTASPIAAIGGNRVVFWTYTGHGTLLSVSDGTDAGTSQVANVYNLGNSAVALNGSVYFAGRQELNYASATLWRTDGTAAGTRAVGAIPGGFPSGMSVALGRLWMTTYSGPRQTLSVSDGTSIRVLAPVAASQPIAEFSGRGYFAAADDAHGLELWSSDATPEGTAMAADLEPNIAPSSYPKAVIAAATRLFFTATDNSNTTQTWTTDGTPDGTQIFPFKTYGAARFGDFVYFTPDDKKTDLYRTDGTPEGTQKIYTFPSAASPVAATRSLLYVNVNGSLWATDGTAAGTALAANDSAVPSSAIDIGGRLYFTDLYGGTLYEVNGRQKPRLIVTGIGNGINVAGGRIFSFRSVTGGVALLVDDGTADGLRQLATFGPRGPFALGAIDDQFLFVADDGMHGLEVWSSDGTPEGTNAVSDLRLGPAGWIMSNGSHTAVNDRLLFVAYDNTYIPRLWSSDGTAAGTTMLPATNVYGNVVVAKGLAFFTAFDSQHGYELWQTDGTVDGTQLAGDIDPGTRSSNPGTAFPTRDTLFFAATTLDTGTELWALPLPGRTIAIDDAHAPNGATTATMTVSLDGPSTQPVTATWSSTTGASGAIAFAPGERTKTITFAITPDLVTHRNRFESVRLAQVRGAIATKRFGAVIEEGLPPAGDLSLSIGPSSADVRQRAIIVTNHGPDAVPASTITYRTSSYTPSAAYTTTVPTVAAGASVAVPFTIDGFFAATVSSPTPDPDPTNNSLLASGALARSAGLSISVAPPVLSTGVHATLTIGTATGPVSLTSSDPSVMTVPATASAGNIDVVALAPGRTTLTASAGSARASIDVGVAATGTSYRWPTQMTFAIDGDLTYGSPIRLTAKIPTYAWDASATPTGPVTFYDGDNVLAVAHVNQSSYADTIVTSLLPGPHAIKAVYSGDSHFLGTTAPPQTITIVKPPPVTFYGSYDPRSDTTAEITIVAGAAFARPPSGTITLKNFQEVLAADVPLAGGIARVTTKRLNFVTIFYSGDDLYEPAVVSVTLSAVRHRAAP